MKILVFIMLALPSLSLASEKKCSVSDYVMNTTYEIPDSKVDISVGSSLTADAPYHYQATEYADSGFIVLSILKDTNRGRVQLALARASLESARLELAVDEQTYKVLSCE